MHMFTQNQNYLIYVIIMQQENNHPARRQLVYILAVLLPCVSGCGGGGGSPASAPPQVNIPNPIAGGNNLGGGNAEVLFQNIEGKGSRWLSIVESDSGYISLRGKIQNDTELPKFPNPEPINSITTRFSKISYISAQINHLQDPGRYILRGSQTSTINLNQLDYQLKGKWVCVLCNTDGTVRDGSLAGKLAVDIPNSRATLNLSGDGLAFNFSLDLNKQNELLTTSLPQAISLDGSQLTPVRSEVIGSLFGPNGEEAGALFGIADDQGRVFSGGALGAAQTLP